MFIGVLYALSACFIWGLIFVVPQFMTGFSPIEIALGRYLLFGLFSSGLLLFQLRSSPSFKIWMTALGFSFVVGNFYYTTLVFGLRYLDPAIATLISGLCPITIAFYGNWKQRECRFQSLIIPCIFIFSGILLVNLPFFTWDSANFSLTHYAIGLFCTLCSLGAWTWYVVANSRFLKKNPEIPVSLWSTMIGVGTLFWSVVTGALYLCFQDSAELNKYFIFNDSLKAFIVGSVILGVGCAWAGSYFWNRASLKLPVTLAGQMMIFETIFGLAFIYFVQQRLPTPIEFMGIVSLFFGIAISLQAMTKTQAPIPVLVESN